jgi:hypothetical protein
MLAFLPQLPALPTPPTCPPPTHPTLQVNMMSSPLEEPPEVPATGHLALKESDAFNRPRQYYCPSGKLLSDFGQGLLMDVGQPPHVIAPSLLREMKQVGEEVLWQLAQLAGA